MRQLQETFERNLEEEKSKFENNLSQIKKQGEMEKLKQQTEISNLICKYGDILKQVIGIRSLFIAKGGWSIYLLWQENYKTPKSIEWSVWEIETSQDKTNSSWTICANCIKGRFDFIDLKESQ